MASLIGAGLDSRVRNELDSLEVTLGADRISVAGRIRTAGLPQEVLGPLAGAFDEREPIRAAGPVRVTAPRRASWQVDAFQVREFEFPREVVPRIVGLVAGDKTGQSPGHRDSRGHRRRAGAPGGRDVVSFGPTAMTTHRILVIDDEAGIRDALKQVLAYEGHDVRVAGSGGEGLTIYPDFRPHLVFLDVKMAGLDGLDTLTRLRELDPAATVVMISGHGTIATAVEATQRGAFDFLEKPLDSDRLLVTVRNALTHATLATENQRFKRAADELHAMVGSSPALQGRPRADRQGRPDGGAGADHRREWQRQGTGRAGHPRREPPAGRPVHRGQLRGHPERADRERALRSHEGVVHRRVRRPARQVRAGRRRHPLPRRDRRPVAPGAGQDAARPAGGRGDAGRRRQVDAGGRPGAGGHQQGPRGGNRRGPLPRGPALSPERGADPCAAAPRAGRRHSGPGGALRQGDCREAAVVPSRQFDAEPRSSGCSAAPGPATCASCGTQWNG